MFPLVDSNIYELKVYCEVNQQTAVNVRHYVFSAAPPAGPTSQDFLSRLSPLLRVPYIDLLSDQATYRGLSLQDVSLAPPGPVDYFSDPAGGNRAGGTLPTQVSGIVTLLTDGGAGIRRGRTYVPFPAESDNEEIARPEEAYMTRLEALATQLRSVVNMLDGGASIGTMTPVVWRRTSGAFAIVNGTLTRRKWATQRRRGAYGKANTSPI